MSARLRSGLLGLLFLSGALAQTPPAVPAAVPGPIPGEKPEGKVFWTRHQLRMGATVIPYTATAGTLLMKNEKDEPIALFGFTAYVKEGADPRTRPLLFAYNGGPGSSSIWLHMGILGPRRTALVDVEPNTRGPFKLVDNEFSILDQADLVMLDPVGTGLSRPVGKGEGKDFWSVDGDIQSVSDFIALYLGKYGRWTSPKFVLGESYGGMRTGGVALALLSRHQVTLNGVILVSPFMDSIAGEAGQHYDLPYITFLPAFAAVAWYHQALPDRPAELQPFLRAAEAFARDVYAPVLHKGHRATAEERKRVLEGLVRFTGLSADYWDKANLRVGEERFAQELLRNRRQIAGRIDGRFKLGMLNALGEKMDFDPMTTAIGPAVVATFQDHLREALKVETDRPYAISAPLYKTWDYRHGLPDQEPGTKAPANTAVDLAFTLTQNPRMKVLVQQGWFDLATPYPATEYFLDHLEVAPELRANVTLKFYEAGHMMYIHPPSMGAFKQDLAAFIAANAR